MLLRSSRLGVVFYLFWPACRLGRCFKSFSTRLPIGTEPCRTVPMFNLWTLEWNVQSFNNGTLYWSQEYWDAPIFFPAKDSFAMSEAQPILGLLAPDCLGDRFDDCSLQLVHHLVADVKRMVRSKTFDGPGLSLPGLQRSEAVGWCFCPSRTGNWGFRNSFPVWGIIWGWDVILRWLETNATHYRRTRPRNDENDSFSK
jgi:hypothetical protein